MLTELNTNRFKGNLVLAAYLMTMVQIIVKESNFIPLEHFGEYSRELHFLAFARGPFMLMMLQTHFNHKKKRLI